MTNSGYQKQLDVQKGAQEQHFLGKSELCAALNELLEAERAGARSTLDTLHDIKEDQLNQLVFAIQQDEIRWCRMLIQAIHTLDMEPSRKTGEFYQKVIAITDIKERILFVNRGQAWVVRRLEALIPKVSQSDIKKGLEEMLEAHQTNIHKVEIALQ